MSYVDTLTRVAHSDGRRLVGASFRGVPFFVSAADRAGGRRQVVKQPIGDLAPVIVEDVGGQTPSFQVSGYVLGADYIAQRDALLAALEGTSGPGDLVHPYHGTLRVSVGPVSTRESTVDGGLCSFSITFLHAPLGITSPGVNVDTVGDIDTKADAAVAASGAAFAADYSAASAPNYATESLAAEYTAVIEAAGDALASAVTATQELARMNAAVLSLTSQATTLIGTPAAMLAGLVNLIGDLTEATVDAPRLVILALVDAYNAPAAALAPAVTDTREREAANHAALSAVLRRVLCIEASRLLPTVAFASLGEAVELRDQVMDQLDAQLHLAGDAEYPALVELRSAVAAGVPGDQEYARRLTVELRVAEPSLVVAHRLYGSVDREQEIIDRNSVANPCFMAGDIEVLSDG